ncbi:serine/threonine-protein kinase [Gemmatimonas sp.]|uniref:serine/threonine-protein kinase n=1 Tax=Gemmatimonas sp. TaxID=1962908 RepID=UPI003568BFA2
MTRSNICPRCSEAYDDDVDFCAKDGSRLIRGGQLADLIGSVIAERYRIVSKLGEGGMGQVYLAEHVRMKRKSAVKIMRPSLVHEVEALQRFTREAENASQLSHPNIAAIFDFGESAEGVVYLAMEYIDGETLSAVMASDTSLHPQEVADIIGQAADGLQVAHDMNMLHRDIKPDNIMLGKRVDGTYFVKLVDFGIARTIGGGDQKVTRTGYAVGTPEYMSPEQLAGDLLDARSDLYSLALVAFVALTGKQAFPADSTKEALILRLTSRPQSLQQAREGVEWPESLQEVFNRALSPEPSERFESAANFAEALSVTINSMTPTQTTEMYRRALDARTASIVARAPGGASALVLSGERAIDSRSGSMRVAGAGSNGAGAAVTVAPTAKPKARWPFIIGGVMTVSVAVALYLVSRGKATSEVPTVMDSMAAVTSPVLARSVASVSSAKPESTSTPPAAERKVPAPTSVDAGDKAATGRLKKAKADSVKLTVTRAKLLADSITSASAVRARYPEAPARGMIQRGIDVKAHIVKSNDVRVVIMATPMFMARAETARVFKDNTTKADGSAYDAADPIERWSAWNGLVSSRRAVYVLEVAPDKTPWPTLEPDRVVDFKKGDVTAVELLRDGVAVHLDGAAQLPAVVNGALQLAAGKKVFNTFVATIPPTAFIPRDDATFPKVEVLVRDATRGGDVTRIQLSESLVRRLYGEFAPWRDALAR